MCDYSLHHVKSRPAKVGDKLTTINSSGPVHEGLPHRRIPQRRYAFFLEQTLLFPRR
jgi:hypothetical protein